jgi:hypothetical protein
MESGPQALRATPKEPAVMNRPLHWTAPLTLFAALAAGATLLLLGEPAHSAACALVPHHPPL